VAVPSKIAATVFTFDILLATLVTWELTPATVEISDKTLVKLNQIIDSRKS